MLDGLVVQAMAVAKAGTRKQLEDPPLQEAEVQTEDSPTREEELCSQEVQACRLGEHVQEGQTQMLVPAKGG